MERRILTRQQPREETPDVKASKIIGVLASGNLTKLVKQAVSFGVSPTTDATTPNCGGDATTLLQIDPLSRHFERVSEQLDQRALATRNVAVSLVADTVKGLRDHTNTPPSPCKWSRFGDEGTKGKLLPLGCVVLFRRVAGALVQSRVKMLGRSALLLTERSGQTGRSRFFCTRCPSCDQNKAQCSRCPI